MAARTIPFPLPSGTAATRTPHPLPPTSGVAKVHETSRRYRGLHLIAEGEPLHGPPRLVTLEQTRAIVAQVNREIAQQAARGASAQPSLVPPPTGPAARARRFVLSLLPDSL